MKHPLVYSTLIALVTIALIIGLAFLTQYPGHPNRPKDVPPSGTLPDGAYTFFVHHDDFDKYQRIIGDELGIDPQHFDAAEGMGGTYYTKLGFNFVCLYARNHASFVGTAAGRGRRERMLLVLSSANDNIATVQWLHGGVVESRRVGRPDQLEEPLRTYVENLNSGKWSCTGDY